MGISDYPCPTCKQDHCECYEKGTKTRERNYILESYKCKSCPMIFDCIGDLDKHIATFHSSKLLPRIGAVNGVATVR